MSLLIADGRLPMSVAGIMERRLHSGKADWKNNYFDTGDAFAYAAGGSKFKLVRDAQLLREINPDSKLKSGALVLEDGVYETLPGTEYTRADFKATLERDLSAAEVKAHPLWKDIARDDALLGEYTDVMFAEMKKRFGYTDAMGIYLASGEKVPTLRAAYVRRLVNRSRLYGWNGLGNDYGRLAGVAPEALNAPGKGIIKPNLEIALQVVNEKLLAAGLIIKPQ